jgi:hypothetical protein
MFGHFLPKFGNSFYILQIMHWFFSSVIFYSEGLIYFETSALTGHNVAAVADRLVRDIMEKVEAAVNDEFVPAK